MSIYDKETILMPGGFSPEAMCFSSGSLILFKDNLYFFGSLTSGTNSNSALKYNPETNSWDSFTNLPISYNNDKDSIIVFHNKVFFMHHGGKFYVTSDCLTWNSYDYNYDTYDLNPDNPNSIISIKNIYLVINNDTLYAVCNFSKGYSVNNYCCGIYQYNETNNEFTFIEDSLIDNIDSSSPPFIETLPVSYHGRIHIPSVDDYSSIISSTIGHPHIRFINNSWEEQKNFIDLNRGVNATFIEGGASSFVDSDRLVFSYLNDLFIFDDSTNTFVKSSYGSGTRMGFISNQNNDKGILLGVSFNPSSSTNEYYISRYENGNIIETSPLSGLGDDKQVSKVIYGNQTLIDLTSDTVTAATLLEGYTAHGADGNIIVGTASGGGGGSSLVYPNLPLTTAYYAQVLYMFTTHETNEEEKLYIVVGFNNFQLIGGWLFKLDKQQGWVPASQQRLPIDVYTVLVYFNGSLHMFSGNTSALTQKHYSLNLSTDTITTYNNTYNVKCGAAVVFQDTIVLLGGVASDSIAKTWAYWDEQQDTWTSNTMPIQYQYKSTYYKGIPIVYNNELHILGAGGSSNSLNTTAQRYHYKLSSLSGSFTSVEMLPTYMAMGQGVNYSATVYNNSIYVMTPFSDYEVGSMMSNSIMIYNGSSWTQKQYSSFTELGNVTIPTRTNFVVATYNNKIVFENMIIPAAITTYGSAYNSKYLSALMTFDGTTIEPFTL